MRQNRCSSEEFMQMLENRISDLEQDSNYVGSSQTIEAGEDIDDATREALWEIADRYVTSDPISGDWATETQHEMQTIQDELGVDEDTAKRYMIEVLGFEPEEFEEIESACNTTGMPAAVTQLDDADKIEGCGINCSTNIDGLVTV